MSHFSNLLSNLKQKIAFQPDRTASQVLDDEIRQTQAYLQTISVLRNDRNIACSLPTEVLGMILVEAIQLNMDQTGYEFKAPSWREHVYLSAVCNAWRVAALQCAAFWTCVPVTSSPHYPEMLSRCRQVPVSIRTCITSPFTHQQVAELVDTVPSTQIAEFHVQDVFGQSDLAGSILDHPTPALSSCVIHSFSNLLISRSLWSLPRPMLRHLEINECAISWPSLDWLEAPLLLPQLVTLYIAHPHPIPSLEELTHLISGCPALETLALTCSAPYIVDDIPSSTIQPIVSHALSECIIVDDLTLCDMLFSTVLRIPATAAVAIRVLSFDSENFQPEHTSETLFSSIVQHCPHPTAGRTPPYLWLRFGLNDAQAAFRAFDVPEPEQQSGSNGPLIDVQILSPGSLSVATSAADTSQLISALNFPKTGVLLVYDQRALMYTASFPREWELFLRRHPGIIEVATESIAQLLAILSPCASDPSERSAFHAVDEGGVPVEASDTSREHSTTSEGSVLLPQLAMLAISHITKEPHPNITSAADQLRLFRELRDVVVRRKQMGYPIREARFDEYLAPGCIHEIHDMFIEIGTTVRWKDADGNHYRAQ